jgi:hypothetical protein
VQLAQRFARLGAELVGEVAAHPRVLVERLRGPPGPVQRLDEDRGQRLDQRVLVAQRADRLQRRAGPVARDLVPRPAQRRVHPLSLQPVAGPLDPRAGQPLQRLAAPQIEGGRRILPGEPREPQRVDPVRVDFAGVPA